MPNAIINKKSIKLKSFIVILFHTSLLLNKLHQRRPQDISKFLGIVDHQKEIKRKIRHVQLNFHLTVNVLNRLNVQDRVLFRVNYDKYVGYAFLGGLLEERFDHLLVHLTVGDYDAQLTALG
jgi:hypothetical protein